MSDVDDKAPSRVSDKLCILAVILALAGIFPHGVDAISGLIRAYRGAPPPVATVTSNDH